MPFLPKRLPDRLPRAQGGTDVCGAGPLERLSDGWPGSRFPGHMVRNCVSVSRLMHLSEGQALLSLDSQPDSQGDSLSSSC